MKQTLILFFTTLVVFFASDVHGQYPYAANVTVNITLSGCGVSKLCVQTPDSCDPAGNSTCLFASFKKNVTTNAFSIQVSGNSTGYITVGLTQNATQGNTLFFFCTSNQTQTWIRPNPNGNLTSTNSNLTNVQGQVSGSNIQCEFDIASLNASSPTLRSLDTNFLILLASGTLESLGLPGFLPVSKTFGPYDLSNPAANVATTTSAPSNTTASNTTSKPSGANCALHSNAVLLLVSVITLSILKTV